MLLIRRAKPPNAGAYSVPGGRLEFGETLAAGALRELHEETGVTAEVLGLIDVVDGLFDRAPDGRPAMHYVLVDYAARWTGGTPQAGDDATEAVFVSLDRLSEFQLWPETERMIRQAAALWRPDSGWFHKKESGVEDICFYSVACYGQRPYSYFRYRRLITCL